MKQNLAFISSFSSSVQIIPEVQLPWFLSLNVLSVEFKKLNVVIDIGGTETITSLRNSSGTFLPYVFLKYSRSSVSTDISNCSKIFIECFFCSSKRPANVIIVIHHSEGSKFKQFTKGSLYSDTWVVFPENAAFIGGISPFWNSW